MPPPKPSWGEQKQYDFDVWYCSDPTAMLQVLGWVNVICIIILMFLFTITGTLRDTSGFEFWAEMTWLSWGQLFDGVGGSPDGYLWGTRAVGLVVTFMGILYSVSFVLGLKTPSTPNSILFAVAGAECWRRTSTSS